VSHKENWLGLLDL